MNVPPISRMAHYKQEKRVNVMNLLKIFEPAPIAKPIEDPEEIKKSYKYWRMRIFYSIYLGYALFYFTRKSYTFAMPVMMDELGFTSANLGFLGSLLYITYGFSKFFSGVLSDKSNPRYFMAFGLILTGVVNIFFGFSSSIILFALFWGLNGWFQGFGWPPCTKQLTYWFSRSERGFWWSLKSTSHNVGGAIIPLIAAYCATHWGWRQAMWIPGTMAIIVGFILIERLRDIPASLGLPPVETFKGEKEDTETSGNNSDQAGQLSAKEILFKHVLNNKAVWILALSYFFVYVVRTAVNDWGVLYLVKHKNYSMLAAASGITWFEVGGFIGSIAAGWGSDRFFQGKRVPYMMLCAPLVVLALVALWYVPPGYLMLDCAVMAIIGFLIFGPQLLVGLAAAEFVDKKAACTANGFAGCFAYIGAAATGLPLGLIIDTWSWKGFFVTNLVCSIAIFIILLPLWSAASRPPEEKAVLCSEQ